MFPGSARSRTGIPRRGGKNEAGCFPRPSSRTRGLSGLTEIRRFPPPDRIADVRVFLYSSDLPEILVSSYGYGVIRSTCPLFVMNRSMPWIPLMTPGRIFPLTVPSGYCCSSPVLIPYPDSPGRIPGPRQIAKSLCIRRRGKAGSVTQIIGLRGKAPGARAPRIGRPLTGPCPSADREVVMRPETGETRIRCADHRPAGQGNPGQAHPGQGRPESDSR